MVDYGRSGANPIVDNPQCSLKGWRAKGKESTEGDCTLRYILSSCIEA